MRGRIRIAIACTGLLLVSAASARAQTTFRETGSVSVGGYLVWVRGTNAKVVELFVGRGFRDAFAKAHEMDAAKLQQWIDSVRAVTPASPDDSTVADAQLRGSALGTDVTMMRRVGGTFSGLRLLVSGEDPIKMAEATARDFIAMLDSAAHVTRELSVPPPTIMASMPMHIAAPAADVPPTVPTIAEKPASVPLPAPASTMGSSTADAAPELVLPTPTEPVMMLASRVDILPLPVPAIPQRASSRALAKPVADEPAVVPAPAPAAVVVSPVSVVSPVPVVSPPVAPVVSAGPAPKTAVPARPDVPSDKLIHTPLGPFTVPGALLGDRDKQAQYCYTQLGLKYNPDLKGEITVKLSITSDGGVQDAVVTKRSWQGISAGEVESCVRALAHDWTFASSDPSVTAGAKLLTFSFAP
ncbi:MAG: hypothetical protein JWO39_1583 [Gemmatimonadetes bacterium]|nr:hypothetical protein [Gemmatimonadota bacterium]